MKLKNRSKRSDSKKWGEEQKQKTEVQLLDAALSVPLAAPLLRKFM